MTDKNRLVIHYEFEESGHVHQFEHVIRTVLEVTDDKTVVMTCTDEHKKGVRVTSGSQHRYTISGARLEALIRNHGTLVPDAE